MARFLVYPYRTGSEGATALRDALPGGQLIRLNNSQYQRRDGDVVINWGNGHCPLEHALNRDVTVCINKLTFFRRMEGLSITPPFATSKEEARRHLSLPIFCRTRIEGADGEGTVIADTYDQLTDARLYTQHVPKDREFRVHMGRTLEGRIVEIGVMEKLHRHLDGLDDRVWTGDSVSMVWQMRNPMPQAVRDVSQRCMEAMPELTFAALDVIYHAATDTAYVVEANSAPMMTPRTAQAYATFFQSFVVEEQPTPVVVEPTPEFRVEGSTLGELCTAVEREVARLRAEIERIRRG